MACWRYTDEAAASRRRAQTRRLLRGFGAAALPGCLGVSRWIERAFERAGAFDRAASGQELVERREQERHVPVSVHRVVEVPVYTEARRVVCVRAARPCVRG